MNKHIVIIDDCRISLEMMRSFLDNAGFSVSTSECGVYSNHLIYGHPRPDLIILDVMMPLLSGARKAQLLKQREKSRHIPVLLVSAKEEAELQQITAETGADDYLPKPFSPERLLSAVRKLLTA